jgi:hypothetical protein
MNEYGLSGSATYSVELSGLDEMMKILPNNDYNQISARNLRDVVYTLWLNGGGGGGSFSYTQGPPLTDKSTIGVGGIPANRNFVDVPLQTLFDEMFFPPLDNEYSITANASFEYGAPNPTMNISVTLNQKNDTNFTLASVTPTSTRSAWAYNNVALSPPTLPTGKNDSKTTPYGAQPVDQNYETTYSLVVKQGTVTFPARAVKATWFLYRYYGVINLTSAYGDEFDVSKASNSQLTDIRNALVTGTVINQSKQANQLSSVTYTNPGAYHIFMAWPATDYTAGVPSKFIFNNNEVNIFTLLKTENLANQNGYSSSYKFFISNKKQSSITLSII